MEAKAQPEHSYGYKTHTSMSDVAEIITRVVVAAISASDARQFAALVVKDLQTILRSASMGQNGSMRTMRITIAAVTWLALGPPLERLSHG